MQHFLLLQKIAELIAQSNSQFYQHGIIRSVDAGQAFASVEPGSANELVGFFHQHLWQRLPRNTRRALLFQATNAVAPKPDADLVAGLPIIVAGTLRTASGLGSAARLCYDALRESGAPVYGIDLTHRLKQEADYPNFTFEDGAHLRGTGTLIVAVNAPLMPLAMLGIGRTIVRSKRVVGCWVWELPMMPAEWRIGERYVHEIWTPSRFVADAAQKIAADKPVHVVPYPVSTDSSSTEETGTRSGRPFTVLTLFNMASSFARKNPCASIAAFRRAFGDDENVHMIVKASNMSVFPEGANLIAKASEGARNITIVNTTMDKHEVAQLYRSADCLISLHRSEGFGLTIAEAMIHGLPVVATNWSGNVDFVDDTKGVPVPFTLVPARDPQGTYEHHDMMWAEADVDVAAAELRNLRDDPARRKRLGAQAAAFARSSWNSTAFSDQVAQILDLDLKSRSSVARRT